MDSRDNFYNKLMNKINIVEIIQHYLPLTQKGKNYVGLCPFHDDKTPSLFVSPNHQLFNCFACNTKGNVFTFVQKFKKKNYKEAVIEVCEIANLDPVLYNNIKKQNDYDSRFFRLYETNDLASKLYEFNLHSSKIAKAFIQQRNIPNEFIKYFHLGYAPDDNQMLYKILIESQTEEKLKIEQLTNLITVGLINKKDNNYQDFFKNRIIFPIHDENGNIVGFSGRTLKNDAVKYLNIAETSIFKKHGCLYNINNVYNSDITELYILEGYMDVISLTKIGAKNCVALMGVAMSNTQIDLLKKLPKLEKIILCLDNDNAGKEASLSIAPNLLKNNFNVFFIEEFPNDCKDVDELVNKHNEKDVYEILKKQINYFEFLTNYHISKNKKMSIDAKQKIANIVLQEIKNYADSSVISLHIKKLSQQLDISFDDLKNKFSELTKSVKNDKSINFQSTKYNEPNNPQRIKPKNDYKTDIEKIQNHLFDYECLCIAYLCYGINNILNDFIFEYDFFNKNTKYIFNVLLNIINNPNRKKGISLEKIEQLVLEKKEDELELKKVWELIKDKIKGNDFLINKFTFNDEFNNKFIKDMVNNLIDKRLTLESEQLLISAENQTDKDKANKLKKEVAEILKIKQSRLGKKNK